MILPATFTPALLLVLLSLVCWSYWANTYKMGGSDASNCIIGILQSPCRSWRFWRR